MSASKSPIGLPPVTVDTVVTVLTFDSLTLLLTDGDLASPWESCEKEVLAAGVVFLTPAFATLDWMRAFGIG